MIGLSGFTIYNLPFTKQYQCTDNNAFQNCKSMIENVLKTVHSKLKTTVNGRND